MKYLLIILIFVSCSKQQIRQNYEMTFDLNGKHYQYSRVIISSDPFCGSILNTIEGINDSTDIFLISIVTDSLCSRIYSGDINVGANLFSRSFSGISTSLTISLDKESGNISANFYGTLVSLDKSYSINNGFFFIKINNNESY